jgi:hypothetical protein
MAAEAPTAGGSMWTRKFGPLPLWAYGVAVLIVVGIWRLWSDAQRAKSTQQDPGVQLIGGDQQPPIVFQSYTTVTNNDAPPGAGRTTPPTPAPVPGPVVPPKPVPGPAPAPGTWVPVTRWTKKNPPWDSTIAGIAAHFGFGGNWGPVWNAPQNADLRARRKQADLIQSGDRVFVPAK